MKLCWIGTFTTLVTKVRPTQQGAANILIIGQLENQIHTEGRL